MTDSNTSSHTIDMSQPIYAGFWVRLAAVFLDALVMAIPALILNSALPVVAPILLGVLYKPVFESSSLRATPGKRVMGIMVTDLSNQTIGFKAAIFRYVVSWVSSCLFGLGHLFVFFTKRKQAAHDLLADTLVVHGKPEGDLLEAWATQLKRLLKSV